MLAYDGGDLGKAAKDVTYSSYVLLARVERNRWWHRGPDPEISFLELRKEFSTEPRRDRGCQNKNGHRCSHCDVAVIERVVQQEHISGLHPANYEGLDRKSV